MTGPYHSLLLNDIHAYFPDLLYHSERFQTVRSVLDYLQQVARRSPYETARAEYLRAERSDTEHRGAEYHRAERSDTEHRGAEYHRSEYAARAEYAQQEEPRPAPVRLIIHPRPRTETIFTEFLQTLLPQLRPAASDTLLENQTLTLTAMQSSECAICQDTIEIGQAVRMIRYCTHRFHQACLDPWLQTHTTCPTCRHDLS